MKEKASIERAKEMVEDWFNEAVDFKKYSDPDNNFTISYEETYSDGKNTQIQLIGYFSIRKGRKLVKEYPFDFIVDVKNNRMIQEDVED